MPHLIAAPAIVAAAGTRPKRIEEFAGRINSGHAQVSVARMTSPSGWQEPGQRPEFEEITVVLRGMLRVEHAGGALDVHAGQAVVAAPGGETKSAVTVVGPAASAVSCPSSPALVENVALVGSDDDQPTCTVASKRVPSAKRASAVNCRFCPTGIEGAAGVTTTLAGVRAETSCQVAPRS